MKKNKKVIAFIVSVMMLITTVSVIINATTVSSSAFSFFDCNTTTTTTTRATTTTTRAATTTTTKKLHSNLVVSIAMYEDALGLTESQYKNRYGASGAWCDAFANYVIKNSGLIVVGSGASNMWKGYNGVYPRHTGKSGVQVGDLIFNGSNGSYSHVGICSKISGSTVYFISGNTSQNVHETSTEYFEGGKFDWVDLPVK